MQGPKLEQLLKSSDYISEILDSLKDKLTQSLSQADLNEDATEYFEKAIDLKMSLRFLVDGIETNRALVQVQKEQIQRKKVFVEGLQYYKATLKSQISSSKLDLTNVNDYIQEQPTQQTNWIEDYPKQQEKVLTTLQQFKQRKSEYQEKQNKKLQLTKQIASQQQKYKKIFPQQMKKLYGQVAETSKIFDIKELDTLAISEFKSKKIEQIHSLLYPLKLKELIDLKHINQFDTEELEITIQKGHFHLYDFARQNKIMIEEKQMRFYVACVQKEQVELSQQEVMAVSISRREDFSTEEIFNNLILKQKVKPIYPNATTQAQRNTNNKYSQLNWIGDILGSPSSLINGTQFIDKIKTRVFNLNLIKYAVENIAKKVPPYFFPLFSANEEASKLTSYPILDAKKIMITKCEKTTFDEYMKEIYVPEWVLKAINNYAILKEEQKSSKGKLSHLSIDPVQRKLLNVFIENNNLEELETKDFYSYYRFELLIEKNVLAGFILIPTDYPNRRSIVKLIGYKKPADSNHNIPQLHQSGKNIVSSLDADHDERRAMVFSEQLKEVEAQLNEKIDKFLYKGSKKESSSEQQRKKEPFVLYFQINRLISIFIEKSLHVV